MAVWDCIDTLRKLEEDFIVITVAAQRGSVPSEAGAKAVVTREGLAAGTLGGGKVEARAIDQALAMLGATTRTALVTWNLQRDIGMTCGGEMTLLFERVAARHHWHVVIFGAGHVSQALVRILATMRCQIEVIDERPDWLARLPELANVRRHSVPAFEDGVLLVQQGSFVLSITKGHASDRPVLRELLLRHGPMPAFIGVIGSAAKRATLHRELSEDGVPKERLSSITCPVGLPIGGNDPAEIAISIAAQLLEKRGDAGGCLSC